MENTIKVTLGTKIDWSNIRKPLTVLKCIEDEFLNDCPINSKKVEKEIESMNKARKRAGKPIIVLVQE